MSKIILVANRAQTVSKEDGALYMGVDKGALLCMQKQLPMVCAVGDFDSIDQKTYEKLCSYCEVIVLPQEKDMVDSEYALRHAHSLGYEEIVLSGVTGGRMDHFMVIYELLKFLPFPFTIEDEQNRIYRLDKGTYFLPKRSKYLSFFACEPLIISIKGVKYPLHEISIQEKDVYLSSNEIIGEHAELTVSGRVIVMECQEK